MLRAAGGIERGVGVGEGGGVLKERVYFVLCVDMG